jgi:hypothetical protein
VVASEDRDTLWVASLQGKEQRQRFEAVQSAVHDIALRFMSEKQEGAQYHEDVVCCRGLARYAKQLK